MANPPEDEGFDWIEAVVKLAGMVGMNKVRVRWKLMRFREGAAQQGRRVRTRTAHVRYEHKICGRCGAINDREAKVCVECEERLRSHTFQQVERLGVSAPDFLSVSTVLCVAMIAIYALLATESAGGLWSLDSLTLLRHGGSYPPAVYDGEWWRLGTSIFLHAGLWHIGFNTIALWQIGPSLEGLYGRHRMLFFFMLTGVLAAAGSVVFRAGGVGIGASGAIMGLIGLAAGWGQRDGTTVGREVRNRMVKWAIYVMLFGWFIGADNMAHGIGFLAGGAMGFLGPALKPRDTGLGPLSMGMGAVGVLAALLSAGLTVLPPAGADRWTGGEASDLVSRSVGTYFYEMGEVEHEMSAADWRRIYDPWLAICAAQRDGDEERALRLMRDQYPGSPDVELGAENVAASCQAIDDLGVQCGKYRERGIQVFVGDDHEAIAEEYRGLMARHYDSFCSGLEGARVPPGTP